MAWQLGLTTIPFEQGDTPGSEHFVEPAWFVETFIIDRRNAEFRRYRKDKLLAVNSLRVRNAVRGGCGGGGSASHGPTPATSSQLNTPTPPGGAGLLCSAVNACCTSTSRV